MNYKSVHIENGRTFLKDNTINLKANKVQLKSNPMASMTLKTRENIKLKAKEIGLTLKAFDSGRNRSLNNDFNSIVPRENFVQKDHSMGMVLKSVPETETSLDINIRDRDNQKIILRKFDTGGFKRASGNKPFTRYSATGDGYPNMDPYTGSPAYMKQWLFSDDVFENTMNDTGDLGD